jgi:hypothetical protein
VLSQPEIYEQELNLAEINEESFVIEENVIVEGGEEGLVDQIEDDGGDQGDEVIKEDEQVVKVEMLEEINQCGDIE